MNCYSWSHLKSQCPFIRCFYCGKKGHIKKRCLQLELHKAIQILKEIETKGETNGKVKENKRRKQTFRDRIKEIEFGKEGNNYIMNHMGQDLGMYIGDWKFKYAKGGFTHIQLLNWKMEKKIKQSIPAAQVKLSKYLPHQYGDCGEVLNGNSFLYHLHHKYRSYFPEGSLINGNPYRFWIL